MSEPAKCGHIDFALGSCSSCGLDEQDLVYRLRKRAEIRRQIPGRKSVQEGKPDRMAALLDEAATEIETLRKEIKTLRDSPFWQ